MFRDLLKWWPSSVIANPTRSYAARKKRMRPAYARIQSEKLGLVFQKEPGDATLAGRIEHILRERHIGQRELSRRSGLDPIHVSKFLHRARKSPKATLEAPTVAAIANGAGVSVRWLLTGEGSRNNPTVAANDDMIEQVDDGSLIWIDKSSVRKYRNPFSDEAKEEIGRAWAIVLNEGRLVFVVGSAIHNSDGTWWHMTASSTVIYFDNEFPFRLKMAPAETDMLKRMWSRYETVRRNTKRSSK